MKNKHRPDGVDGVVKAEFKVRLSKMPELSHWPDRNKPFSYENSEICKWLVQQPEALAFLCDRARGTRMIVYDAESQMWHGIGSNVREDGQPKVES